MSDRPPRQPDPEEGTLPGGGRAPYGQTKRVRPKTYKVAIYLVLAVFVVQAAFFFTIPWFRHQIAIDTRSPEVQRERQKIENSPAPAPATPPPATPAVPLNPLKPSLGPARIAVPVDPALRVDELVREGYNYMQQGETDLARSALLEAETISPKDLRVLCYQAELAESERDFARAATYWKRIADLGAAAGPLADQAKVHLASLANRPAGDTAPPAASPASTSSSLIASTPAPTSPAPPAAEAPSSPVPTAPAPAAPAATDAPAADASATSAPAPTASQPLPLPEGGKFFTVLTPTKVAAEDGTGFVVRIPIVCAMRAGIDPGKVGIKLFFYDRLLDGALSPTSAKIEVAFENSHATWQDGRTEVLRAVYRKRPLSAAEAANPKGVPAYHGYVFRLTYDNVLQDERSEPAALLRTVFPLPPKGAATAP
ncbi:hypothetical protein [Verrucomicrobium sp. GAS474]|uniref:tetratricopeptide repeat protein n=1 Tax=Verrucomicrobium sp. GAS474 TaxID=1882831 RepID=UPI0012FFBDF4|nr:hypothetical protein [Verrucomicrobium sp. GAS474]